MTLHSVTVEQKLICLVFNLPNSDTITYRLDPDCNVIVGGDERCGMRLAAETISDRHCMIRYAAGEILVTDWFSEFGTFVNDRRITEETRVRANDTLRLGNHELKVMMHDLSAHPHSEPAVFAPIVTLIPDLASYSNYETTAGEPDVAEPESTLDRCESRAEESESRPSYARLQVEFAQALDELAFLRHELEAQLAKPIPAAGSNDGDDVPWQLDLDELRAENIRLQTELAERDAALLANWDQESQGHVPDIDSTPTDTEALVERLEQLLDELQSADRRVATLDDLLRSSADEHRAELEEREHLENWVAEIEQRVSEREESWKAERTRLEAKISEQLAQRQQSDKMLAETLRSQAGEPAEKLVVDLQRKYDKAIEHLESAHQEIERLKRVASSPRGNADNGKRVQELEAIIRKREVDISQERASLARQRAELDRARVDVERVPRALDRADENDIRIQAFRAHLRGIHEQEQIEKKEHRATSLAGRIAQLWQRMDGSDR